MFSTNWRAVQMKSFGRCGFVARAAASFLESGSIVGGIGNGGCSSSLFTRFRISTQHQREVGVEIGVGGRRCGDA
jgi:hypothetical protein